MVSNFNEIEFYKSYLIFSCRKTSGTKRNDVIDLVMDALKGNLEADKSSGQGEEQFEKDAAIKTTGKTLKAFSGKLLKASMPSRCN